uniref:Integrase, catalytic region, zinc finger, CCHC-type, peptidase aspartic, catalytic n=1 Tax=Tanacetum cinerariifolium TaxID=118510 RepID=A0A6L2JJ27_TANCI|nr:hypothetical protein [Tanacetum cinerariifolium]
MPKAKEEKRCFAVQGKSSFGEAQGNGKVLTEEELEFLADPGIAKEVPHFNNTNNDMLNQSVQEMSYSEQTRIVNYPDNEITSDNDAMISSVFEQLSQQVTNCNKVNKDNLITNESLTVELERYKEQSLTTTFNVLKNESKDKETKNIDKEIALEKKVKELDNIVYKMGQSAQTIHMLTKPQVFYDNILKQALGFQNPFYLKKAQQIRPMLYDEQELSAEQAFWFQMSNPFTDSSDASLVKLDIPSELPKASLVNASLKQLKFHLAQFDSVVKNRVTPNALTKDLPNKITEVQTVFNQMETAVQQYSVDKRCLEIANNQVLNENDQLLEQIISQDIINIAVNSSLNMNAFVNVNSSTAMNDSVNYFEICNKCLELEVELIC